MGFPVSKLLFIQMPQIPIWEWGVGGNQWQQLFMAKSMKDCLPSPLHLWGDRGGPDPQLPAQGASPRLLTSPSSGYSLLPPPHPPLQTLPLTADKNPTQDKYTSIPAHTIHPP